MSASQTIFITGANKGIGLEVARQLARVGHHLYLGVRSMERGRTAAAELAREGLKVELLEIDTGSQASIAQAAISLGNRISALNVLINNAAVLPARHGSILDTDAAELGDAFTINTIGPIVLTLRLLPLLERGRPARVINVSSRLGSVSEMSDGWSAYGISKAALNAASRKLAQAVRSRGISVLAASPGWVKTEMGGAEAPLSIEQGGRNISRLVTELPAGVSDQFLGEHGPIPW